MRTYPFSNTTGGPIPAGAALVPSAGEDANGLLLVTRPTADSSLFVVFNGPSDVPNGGKGVAFGWDGGSVPVGIDPADEPYTSADTFGTQAASWLPRKGKKGFRVVTPSVRGIANAVPDPATTGAINTQNVDGTESDAATTDIRTDQATFLKTETETDHQRFYIDLDGLSDGLVMDQSASFVTQICLTTTTTKTFSEAAGEEHLMTNVVVNTTAVVKRRSVTLLSGTVLGAEVCVAAETACCEPPPPPAGTFGGCGHVYPGIIYATFSGATGTCGCFAGSFALTWNAGVHQYEGTFSGCTGAVPVQLLIDSTTTPTLWTFSIAGASYTYSSATASQTFAFSCGDLVTGITVDVDAGACVGSFAVDFSE